MEQSIREWKILQGSRCFSRKGIHLPGMRHWAKWAGLWNESILVPLLGVEFGGCCISQPVVFAEVLLLSIKMVQKTSTNVELSISYRSQHGFLVALNRGIVVNLPAVRNSITALMTYQAQNVGSSRLQISLTASGLAGR